VDHARRLWLRALEAQLAAEEAHGNAAELFGCLRDRTRLAIERERAAAARRAYEMAIAQHPEWTDGAVRHPGSSVSGLAS
jgi:hypothetical protein